MERVKFECSKLVDIDCNTEEDVVIGENKDDKIRLLVLKSKNLVSPTCGILVENVNVIEETNGRKLSEIEVITK